MKKIFLIIILGISISVGFAQNAELPLIPYPASIQIGQGEFLISEKSQLILNDDGKFTNEVYFLQSMLKPVLGQYLSAKTGENIIEFNYSTSVNSPEGYQLDISPQKVSITASSPTGAFYALQTIRQLLPAEIESGHKLSGLSLPVLKIADQPSFEWRGIMLDVSRHFFSLEYLKKQIDRLALYKMNKFHLHLTDDEGWRVEIKKYPDLTGKSAWRNYNTHDAYCIRMSAENPDFKIDSRYIIKKEEKDIYGGYYTQDQIKELIEYASARYVEIIPEIDMPGHMMAAISAYPYLADNTASWGKVFSIPLCPGKEEVYTFVQDVLTEVIEMFPSQYIHIGGDEVDKVSWEESALCKKMMEEHDLKSIDELQSYFIRQVQQFIESKGKKLVGWDEILDGGVDSNANVMYWRGWVNDAPLKSVKNGNNVIMSPTFPLYFDWLPSKNSLNDVYHMSVISSDIPTDKAHLIKGAQANLWTHETPTEKRADFMIFPRMTALAERVWTNKDLFDSYSQRILKHYSRLEALGINYRLPDIQGFAQESVFTDHVFFNLKSPVQNMKIHYTTDGSLPNANSFVLNEPLRIDKPQQVKFALFNSKGLSGEVFTINYRKSQIKKAVKTKATNAGLICNFYDQRIDKTTKIRGEASKTFIVSNIEVPSEINAPSFGAIFNGYINIPETGIYSFYFNCDDSGRLFIDDEEIIDNEGPHSPLEKSGQAALAKGLHPIRIEFVEGGGGYTLSLQYSFKGSEPANIPDSWLIH